MNGNSALLGFVNTSEVNKLTHFHLFNLRSWYMKILVHSLILFFFFGGGGDFGMNFFGQKKKISKYFLTLLK